MIQVKRAYDEPSRNDGIRVLVDRIWPRGLSKKQAEIDEWMKEIAPSTELRKWFGHDADKWEEFQKKYREELENVRASLEALRQKAVHQNLTLIYGARDKKHNQAIVLKNVLEEIKLR